MKIREDKDELIIQFEPTERELLLTSLFELKKHYKQEITELPDPLKKFWIGQLSRSTDPEEVEELLEDLAAERLELRSERLKLLENWLSKDSSLLNPTKGYLRIAKRDIDHFLCLLNDRRITLALIHGITEEQMDWDPFLIKSKTLQQAIWEIHFLAYLQENCISYLMG
ncbi:hypothetical protein [Methylacidiphilum caldifontis]|uniref:DUF2017 domain-containing protein n=1 Tax=Methylacidiphilum caldifontis TaxID=2795386 RepID=A0A4Y8PC25_9BACT|nr:hypothetical protein [Methylacidiphilum caldifontis]QSR89345.1 hypothetical protein IT6_03440 [Methylacidiphilum caldifontis]TFE68767.1 hypothetical protein A7Q10_07755 [Methylacidiphilum caldifontis]